MQKSMLETGPLLLRLMYIRGALRGHIVDRDDMYGIVGALHIIDRRG
jgi:hypothetical protein